MGSWRKRSEVSRQTQQQATSFSIFSKDLHIFLPDLLVLPAPKTTCRALVLTWTLGLGTPGWGHRFRKGDAKLLTTCPPPVPALGLTSLKGGREGEPGGRLTCPPGQPSSQLLAPRLAQPGALVRLGVGANCRLQPISVPLPGGAPAGVAGHRVRSPALSGNLRYLGLILNPLPLLYRW